MEDFQNVTNVKLARRLAKAGAARTLAVICGQFSQEPWKSCRKLVQGAQARDSLIITTPSAAGKWRWCIPAKQGDFSRWGNPLAYQSNRSDMSAVALSAWLGTSHCQ
jgi:hypothetical protein